MGVTHRDQPLRAPAGCQLTRRDVELFGAGLHTRLYEKLGAHPTTVDGTPGVTFAVWAPNARSVAVVGDFDGWNPPGRPLEPIENTGIWAGFVAHVGCGAMYKYHLISRIADYTVDKADPFAFSCETPPGTASRVCDLGYDWNDGRWLHERASRQSANAPISIYELHLGSWKRPDDDSERRLSYREIAAELVPYLARMNFTHVELMPPTEHPYYGSWGYQTTGYFAATSRYGSPQELMHLIDELHRAGIGVILDWVPSHFPTDEHGIGFFDGTHLYEHADPRLGFHPDWSSLIFNYARKPVRSFLLSSARFWVERYHTDAIRVDAVASMLYRDYSRPEGEWIPNEHGGRENLEAITLLRDLNTAIHTAYPDVLTIAEESTTWPLVSHAVNVGGLGFDMKWDMGWMHDTLAYMREDPIHRKYHHQKLTFRMIYAFSENFVLPLSHDEVVHGKGSLLGRMTGDTWQRFANLRALYGYMYAQPGKKLLFMGSELGPWNEWSHERGLDWSLTRYPLHAGLQRWVADLNRVYREEPLLHRTDFTSEAFKWVDCADSDQSAISFVRGPENTETEGTILVVGNFTPVPRHNYRVGVPVPGRWKELLNSDAETYGGSGQGNYGEVQAVAMRFHDQPYSLSLTLPPLSVLFLRHETHTRRG